MEERTEDNIPVWLIAQADQLEAMQREHKDKIREIVESARAKVAEQQQDGINDLEWPGVDDGDFLFPNMDLDF